MKALGLAVGLGLLAWGEAALACTCDDYRPIVPDGARDVPANTKIWIPEKQAELLFRHHLRATGAGPERPLLTVDETKLREAITLHGPAGEVSELQLTSLELNGLGRYFTLTPHHRLMPGKHTLFPRVAQTREQRTDWGSLGAEFEVGTASREAPLVPPTARIVRWDNQDHGMCGQYVGATLAISPHHWLLAYHAVDPDKPNDSKSTREEYALTSTGAVWFGDSSCNWSWAFSRSSARVRFGSIDYAGRFSGYGPPVELVAPWAPAELYAQSLGRIERRSSLGGCACRLRYQDGADAAGAAWLLLIAAWALRRTTIRAGSAAAGRRFGARPKAMRRRW